MKIKNYYCGSTVKILIVLFAAVILLPFSGCFSPSGGEEAATISLNLGSGGLAVYPTEIASLEHEITLKGPTGTVKRTVRGGGLVTFQVSSGVYSIEVKATGATPAAYNLGLSGEPFALRMLRAHGTRSGVSVTGGTHIAVPLEMVASTEVATWPQLLKAFELAGLKETIVVSRSMETVNIPGGGFPASPVAEVSGGRQITLVTEWPVTIIRGPAGGSDSIFNVNNGTLILGRSGMTGRLTIDGGAQNGL